MVSDEGEFYRMKKIVLWVAASLLVAGSAQAQLENIDFGVASEVVRNMMSAQTGEEIMGSTNLHGAYKNYALEQELAQEAARRGLQERIDVQRTMEEARRSVMIRALRNDIIRSIPPPAADKIKSTYEAEAAKGRWALPAGFKLDVFGLPGANPDQLAAANKLATGEAVEDAALAALKLQQLSSQATGSYLSSNQVAGPIWKELMEMKLNELRVFPDGTNHLVVRRGAYAGPRELKLEEATEVVKGMLLREKQDAAWDEYVRKKQKSLGLE